MPPLWINSRYQTSMSSLCVSISLLWLQVILIFTCVNFSPTKYDTYIFPAWADGLGFILTLTSILAIPAVGLFKLFMEMRNTRHSFLQVRWIHEVVFEKKLLKVLSVGEKKNRKIKIVLSFLQVNVLIASVYLYIYLLCDTSLLRLIPPEWCLRLYFSWKEVIFLPVSLYI